MIARYFSAAETRLHQHDGTESLAIRNTWLRRSLTILAIRITSRLHKDMPSYIFPISKRILVKTGPYVHLTEAATMTFLAENTHFPIPKVYCSFVHKNRAYIVMERLRGKEIHAAWIELDETSRKQLLAQLRCMMKELRELKPPSGGGVQSCTGGSLRDSRIPHCLPRFGPFSKVADFHLWLREGLAMPEIESRQNTHDDWTEIKNMALEQEARSTVPLVFTHCDLNPWNILVHDGKISGIIDWEFSGYYPDYWEYTSAWYVNRLSTFWQEQLDNFLDAYPVELRMEITRQKWWGDL